MARPFGGTAPRDVARLAAVVAGSAVLAPQTFADAAQRDEGSSICPCINPVERGILTATNHVVTIPGITVGPGEVNELPDTYGSYCHDWYHATDDGDDTNPLPIGYNLKAACADATYCTGYNNFSTCTTKSCTWNDTNGDEVTQEMVDNNAALETAGACTGTPSYCTETWCFVDPCLCSLPDMQQDTYFAETLHADSLAMSFSTCAQCPTRANRTDCVSHPFSCEWVDTGGHAVTAAMVAATPTLETDGHCQAALSHAYLDEDCGTHDSDHCGGPHNLMCAWNDEHDACEAAEQDVISESWGCGTPSIGSDICKCVDPVKLGMTDGWPAGDSHASTPWSGLPYGYGATCKAWGHSLLNDHLDHALLACRDDSEIPNFLAAMVAAGHTAGGGGGGGHRRLKRGPSRRLQRLEALEANPDAVSEFEFSRVMARRLADASLDGTHRACLDTFCFVDACSCQSHDAVPVPGELVDAYPLLRGLAVSYDACANCTTRSTEALCVAHSLCHWDEGDHLCVDSGLALHTREERCEENPDESTCVVLTDDTPAAGGGGHHRALAGDSSSAPAASSGSAVIDACNADSHCFLDPDCEWSVPPPATPGSHRLLEALDSAHTTPADANPALVEKEDDPIMRELRKLREKTERETDHIRDYRETRVHNIQMREERKKRFLTAQQQDRILAGGAGDGTPTCHLRGITSLENERECSLMRQWPTTGQIPPPTTGACVTRMAHSMYSFAGGHNDIYVADLIEGNWKRIVPRSALKPPPRIGCSMVAVEPVGAHTANDGSIYVFGGADADGRLLDDLWVFTHGRWSLIGPSTEGVGGTWPVAREFAAISGFHASSGADYLVLFGGAADHDLLGDTWLLPLDVDQWDHGVPTWDLVPGSGMVIGPRSESSLRQYDGGSLVMFGGTKFPFEHVDLHDAYVILLQDDHLFNRRFVIHFHGDARGEPTTAGGSGETLFQECDPAQAVKPRPRGSGYLFELWHPPKVITRDAGGTEGSAYPEAAFVVGFGIDASTTFNEHLNDLWILEKAYETGSTNAPLTHTSQCTREVENGPLTCVDKRVGTFAEKTGAHAHTAWRWRMVLAQDDRVSRASRDAQQAELDEISGYNATHRRARQLAVGSTTRNCPDPDAAGGGGHHRQLLTTGALVDAEQNAGGATGEADYTLSAFGAKELTPDMQILDASIRALGWHEHRSHPRMGPFRGGLQKMNEQRKKSAARRMSKAASIRALKNGKVEAATSGETHTSLTDEFSSVHVTARKLQEVFDRAISRKLAGGGGGGGASLTISGAPNESAWGVAVPGGAMLDGILGVALGTSDYGIVNSLREINMAKATTDACTAEQIQNKRGELQRVDLLDEHEEVSEVGMSHQCRWELAHNVKTMELPAPRKLHGTAIQNGYMYVQCAYMLDKYFFLEIFWCEESCRVRGLAQMYGEVIFSFFQVLIRWHRREPHRAG